MPPARVTSDKVPRGLLRGSLTSRKRMGRQAPSNQRGAVMAGVQTLDFDSPDETRTPEKTRMDVVRVGPTTAARLTFEPGWKWSECIKPVAGTESCQVRHVGMAGSGRLTVRHEDGSEEDI